MNRLTDIRLDIETTDRNLDRYPDRNEIDICPARYMENNGISDNPMLCALPFPLSGKQIRSAYKIPVPGYDRNEISDWPVWKRKKGILDLDMGYEPLCVMEKINEVISNALEKSYMGRDIWLDLVNSDQPTIPVSKKNILSGSDLFFLVYGETGCGKSKSVQLIMSSYPKAVRHVIGDFECIQIPILYVTALNGNMSELLLAMAQQVDEILGCGDLWAKKVSRKNVGVACSVIKEMIKRYLIGLIVIDEAEFLPFSGNTSIENLIGISESTGCAIGMIGNNDLQIKYDNYVRLARRSAGNRIKISTTEEDDRLYFRKAVEGLWKYQWTKVYTDMNDDILNALCNSSMYNISLLKALIMDVQSEFVTGYSRHGEAGKAYERQITAEDIHMIAERDFSEVRTLIYAGTSESDKAAFDIMSGKKKSISEDAQKLRTRAHAAELEEELRIQEVWGETKYWQVEDILHDTHGMSTDHIKMIINKLMYTDPSLPEKDIPVIVNEVLDYDNRNGNKKTDIKKCQTKIKQIDPQAEADIRTIINEKLEKNA